MTDTRKWNYNCTGSQLAILIALIFSHARSWRGHSHHRVTCWHFFSFTEIVEIVVHGRNAEICHSSIDINISDLGGHVTLSGCRSLSQSLFETFRALHGRKHLICGWNFNVVWYRALVSVQCIKCIKFVFRRVITPARTPLRKLMTLPKPSSRLGRGHLPLIIHRP